MSDVGTWAEVEDGVIVNTALASAEVAAERGWVELPEGAGIGWRMEEGAWTAPAAPPVLPTVDDLAAALSTATTVAGLKKVISGVLGTLADMQEA